MNRNIKERLYNLLPQTERGIEANSHLINDGYFSSLDYMSFLVSVESEFNVQFSNDDLAFGCLFTPWSIIDKLEQLLSNE